MKYLRCRMLTCILGLGLLYSGGAASAAERVLLTDREMENVTAGSVIGRSLLSSLGAISVSTSNAVATPYGNLIVGLNAGLHIGLGSNSIYYRAAVTR